MKKNEIGRVCKRCNKFKEWKNFGRYTRRCGKSDYRSRCKDCVNAQKKEYVSLNKEKITLLKKEYRQTQHGKDVVRANKAKRKAILKKIARIPYKRSFVLQRDNYTCKICGIKVHDDATNWNTHDKAHIDHIIPISHNGPDTLENVQTLCRTCNLKKSDKLVFNHLELQQGAC